MIIILFVCHGNICRSVMAQYILTDMLQKRGLSARFEVDSAAVSRYSGSSASAAGQARAGAAGGAGGGPSGAAGDDRGLPAF